MGLQVLREEVNEDRVNSRILQTITNIEESCDVSIGILNDLLLYDKLDSDLLKLDKERLDVSDFLTETLQPFHLQVRILCIYIYD